MKMLKTILLPSVLVLALSMLYACGSGSSKSSGGGTSVNLTGTWSGNYTLTTDFLYYCTNITTLNYSGTVTWTISEDAQGSVTGTVTMSNIDVVSVSGSDTCTKETLTSWSAPIPNGAGIATGDTVLVEAEYNLPNNYQGSNELLDFSGELDGSSISGTIIGTSAGGIGGTNGTFSVTKQP